MRKLTLTLLAWLFLPKGSTDDYLAAAGKANRWDFLKCGLLTLAVLLVLEEGLVIYGVWVITAIAFGVYQYLWVFSYPVTRPVLYEETSLIFLGLVLVSHAAFAVLCGAGYVGMSLLVFSWLYFGRILGRFAVAKEVRKILHAVRQEYAQESPDQQIEIAEQMLQTRIEDVRSL
jgi:hypothetical protein